VTSKITTFLISSTLALAAGTGSSDYEFRNSVWKDTLRNLSWGTTPQEVWLSETSTQHAKNDCFDPRKGNNVRHIPPEQKAEACLGRDNIYNLESDVEFYFRNNRLVAVRYHPLAASVRDSSGNGTYNYMALKLYMAHFGGMFDYLGGPGVSKTGSITVLAQKGAIGHSINESLDTGVDLSMQFRLNDRTVGEVAGYYLGGMKSPYFVDVYISQSYAAK
jgi:hypothetical protein